MRRTADTTEATVLTLGHSYPAVANVLRERVGKGTAFFGPSRYEVELAELLKEVRFFFLLPPLSLSLSLCFSLVLVRVSSPSPPPTLTLGYSASLPL